MRKKEEEAVTAKQIKSSLLSQLKSKGAEVDHFVSLVEDYVWMWEQIQEMQKDIIERGRHFSAISSQGKEYEKENPAVKDAILYSKQMLSLLKELDLSTDNCPGGDDNKL